MTSNFRTATRVLLALALLAPLPLFAIGRDLTPVRIATPEHSDGSSGMCGTAHGFLLRWGSQARAYGTTTDADGVPRLPATSMPPVDGKLFADGDGCLALSQKGVTELDAGGAVRRTAVFDTPLYFSRAAFNGTNFFLFDGIVGSGFRGRIVDRNAHVLSTTTLPITEYSSSDAAVTASADGGFTIIVADVVEGIYAMQINAAGQMSGPKVD